MVTVKVSPSSGIITVTVRAFSPDDAQNILQAIILASENTVNDVNKRMWQDVIATAEINLERRDRKPAEAQAKPPIFSPKAGILDVASSAQLLSNLTAKIEAEKMKLEQQYDSSLASFLASPANESLAQRDQQ
jgi:capsular polysaccharide transport system permease protein